MSTITGNVRIDELTVFRATYDPALRWNGWLGAPAFDRAEVERIAEWVKEDNTFTWDGDVLLHTEHHYRDEDPEGYTPERIEPDADGRYAVGGFNWCWYAADEDNPPPVVGNAPTLD